MPYENVSTDSEFDSLPRLSSARTAFAAASILLCAGALAPRLAAQTVGPITPNPSSQVTQPQQAPPPAPAPAAVAKANLAGAWKFDKDESDDPREKMRDATDNSAGRGRGQGQGGRGGGWGMGGPGMGGPGMGGGPWGGGQGQGGGGWGGNRGGANGGNNGDDADARAGGAMDMNDLSQLAIEQSDTSAKVTGGTGRILAVYSSSNPNPTNKPPKKSSDDTTYAPPAGQLQDGQLVVVTEGRQRGMKTTRTYALSPDRTQLYVTTKLENPRYSQPVVIRFVYDQGRPASGA